MLRTRTAVSAASARVSSAMETVKVPVVVVGFKVTLLKTMEVKSAATVVLAPASVERAGWKTMVPRGASSTPTVMVTVSPSATVEAVAVPPVAELAVKPMLRVSLSAMVMVWVVRLPMLQSAGKPAPGEMVRMMVSLSSVSLSSRMVVTGMSTVLAPAAAVAVKVAAMAWKSLPEVAVPETATLRGRPPAGASKLRDRAAVMAPASSSVLVAGAAVTNWMILSLAAMVKSWVDWLPTDQRSEGDGLDMVMRKLRAGSASVSGLMVTGREVVVPGVTVRVFTVISLLVMSWGVPLTSSWALACRVKAAPVVTAAPAGSVRVRARLMVPASSVNAVAVVAAAKATLLVSLSPMVTVWVLLSVSMLQPAGGVPERVMVMSSACSAMLSSMALMLKVAVAAPRETVAGTVMSEAESPSASATVRFRVMGAVGAFWVRTVMLAVAAPSATLDSAVVKPMVLSLAGMVKVRSVVVAPPPRIQPLAG